MSWIQNLYDTYNNCQSMVGMETEGNTVPLLPICHTTQMAQIEVVIDGNGRFRRASVIPKNEARTIIPCTEKSGGRTSGEAAHPLCDKLQYVAPDYEQFGGSKKPYTTSYIANLEAWCCSEYSHAKARAVLSYVKKGEVIRDLVEHHVLFMRDDKKLLSKWEKKDEPAPLIFKLLSAPEDAFVRWVVEVPGDLEARAWRDETLWESWIQYYSKTKKAKSLCYVTGQEELIAEQHPAKLTNDGDKAKLISSNDNIGFTFRGRFITADQAAAVGFEVTQKAHSALRWLISRQGYRKGSLAIVAWAISGAPIPKPTDDPLAILGLGDLPSDEQTVQDTAQEVAIRLKKKIAGYGKSLGDITGIVVMGVDSATPGQGRMAITYYQVLTGSDFLRRVNNWHESCAWLHSYGSINVPDSKNGELKAKHIPFIGAPAPIDIAEAAYGQKADDRLKQATIARILPCIIEGRQIPRDLVDSSVRRACNRTGMEHWEWNKTLSIACSLFRKYNTKENYDMALDPNRKTRDYLYGRLLALAEGLEAWSLAETKEKRDTNAMRLMQRFAERPNTTWRTIELALGPYKARLGGKSNYYQRMIDDVMAKFEDDEFLLDKRLSGEFLLGYHCQREALFNRNGVDKNTDDKTDES